MREEAGIWNNIAAILGDARIQAKEHAVAGKILDFVHARLVVAELNVKEQLEKEGKTVAA